MKKDLCLPDEAVYCFIHRKDAVNTLRDDKFSTKELTEIFTKFIDVFSWDKNCADEQRIDADQNSFKYWWLSYFVEAWTLRMEYEENLDDISLEDFHEKFAIADAIKYKETFYSIDSIETYDDITVSYINVTSGDGTEKTKLYINDLFTHRNELEIYKLESIYN